MARADELLGPKVGFNACSSSRVGNAVLSVGIWLGCSANSVLAEAVGEQRLAPASPIATSYKQPGYQRCVVLRDLAIRRRTYVWRRCVKLSAVSK